MKLFLCQWKLHGGVPSFPLQASLLAKDILNLSLLLWVVRVLLRIWSLKHADVEPALCIDVALLYLFPRGSFPRNNEEGGAFLLHCCSFYQLFPSLRFSLFSLRPNPMSLLRIDYQEMTYSTEKNIQATRLLDYKWSRSLLKILRKV